MRAVTRRIPWLRQHRSSGSSPLRRARPRPAADDHQDRDARRVQHYRPVRHPARAHRGRTQVPQRGIASSQRRRGYHATALRPRAAAGGRPYSLASPRHRTPDCLAPWLRWPTAENRK
jgi:hypothetical protein